MRKILGVFLCVILLLSSSLTMVGAEGEGNVDNGGGGIGDGDGNNYWTPGNEGVRVTVIRSDDGSIYATPIDLSNKSNTKRIVHFGKVSKLEYRGRASLKVQVNDYIVNKPSLIMPKIIMTNGTANIEAIKSYFTDELVIRYIANATGVSFDDLISGEYKILLEPIAYFTFRGIFMGMTATEAALYDQKLGGGLRAKMQGLTHKNLPLAMFLEKSDMGYDAWDGPTNHAISNGQIISSLGLGIISFKEVLKESTFDYEYRTDTDVITSVRVHASGGRITPDSNATVTFNVNGQSSSMSVTIPEGSSQLVWIKWHTPQKPQELKMTATVSGNYSARIGGVSRTAKINIKVVDLNEKIPPNPTANDAKPVGYTIPVVPVKEQRTSASWGIWDCKWVPDIQWVEDENGGSWQDLGDWEYEWIPYSASFSAAFSVAPDEKVPTANGKTMKSGYGIKEKVTSVFNSNAPSSHVTGAQNVLSYYPEFNYATFLRLSDRVSGNYNAEFELKQNKFSTYNRRVHFTPVWFPNGRYTVYAEVIDVWTPDGMLSVNLNDYVNISGNLFDDWHIAPKQ